MQTCGHPRHFRLRMRFLGHLSTLLQRCSWQTPLLVGHAAQRLRCATTLQMEQRISRLVYFSDSPRFCCSIRFVNSHRDRPLSVISPICVFVTCGLTRVKTYSRCRHSCSSSNMSFHSLSVFPGSQFTKLSHLQTPCTTPRLLQLISWSDVELCNCVPRNQLKNLERPSP